jgi:hypothetical protein
MLLFVEVARKKTLRSPCYGRYQARCSRLEVKGGCQKRPDGNKVSLRKGEVQDEALRSQPSQKRFEETSFATSRAPRE